MSKSEYDCEELAKIRSQVVCTTGITITNEVIGIVLAGYQETKKKTELPQYVEGLKHERNVLQKICAQRADALEKIGLRSDCTLDEVDAWMAGHVRVPVEPSIAMVDAGVALARQVSASGQGGWRRYIRALYKQMLNASKGDRYERRTL